VAVLARRFNVNAAQTFGVFWIVEVMSNRLGFGIQAEKAEVCRQPKYPRAVLANVDYDDWSAVFIVLAQGIVTEGFGLGVESVEKLVGAYPKRARMVFE
jgi:hypothetical protein